MSNSANTFTILYFSFLQEQSNKEKEIRTLSQGLTAKALFAQICDELSLEIEKTSVRVSINHEFADWAREIEANDIVAFIPPVAGG